MIWIPRTALAGWNFMIFGPITGLYDRIFYFGHQHVPLEQSLPCPLDLFIQSWSTSMCALYVFMHFGGTSMGAIGLLFHFGAPQCVLWIIFILGGTDKCLWHTYLCPWIFYSLGALHDVPIGHTLGSSMGVDMVNLLPPGCYFTFGHLSVCPG